MTISEQQRLAVLYDWHNHRLLGDQTADGGFWLGVIELRSRVAVLGAGTGRVAMPLARAGAAVVAIDRDWHRLRRIEAGKMDVICADFSAMPLRDRFEHMVFPYSAMQLVEPGGVAAVLEGLAPLMSGDGRVWLDVSDRFERRAGHEWREVLDDYCPELGCRVRELQRGMRGIDHFQIDTRYEVGGAAIASETDRWYFHPDAELRIAFDQASLAVRSVAVSYSATSPRHRRIYELSRRCDQKG